MKKLFPIVLSGLLAACSASETAFFHPEVSYLNTQKVSSVPKMESITIVGSALDEAGNYMPSYPYHQGTEHKIVHLSPVPLYVMVACEAESISGNTKTTKRGFKSITGDFKAGKTYMAFCNIQAGNRYEVVLREVPEGTPYATRGVWRKKIVTTQPNDTNRIRFTISSKKSSRTFWGGVGNYMAIQGWDGRFGATAELAAPIKSVKVECQMGNMNNVVIVPLTGNFQAGKNYQLGCRTTDAGLFEAYIVNSQ